MSVVSKSKHPVYDDIRRYSRENNWLKTVSEIVEEEERFDDGIVVSKASKYIEIGIERLRVASNTYSTFPDDFSEFSSLRWVDLRNPKEARTDFHDIIPWISDHDGWYGYVGFGWMYLKPIPTTASVLGCFALFSNEQDAMFFKLRWGGV